MADGALRDLINHSATSTLPDLDPDRRRDGVAARDAVRQRALLCDQPALLGAANAAADLGGDPECRHRWGAEGKSVQRLRNGEGSHTAKQAVPVTLHPSTGRFASAAAHAAARSALSLPISSTSTTCWRCCAKCAACCSPGAIASSRELRRRSRARHPHFEVAQAQGFDAASTLTAMDIEGIDVAVMYGTRGRQVLSHDILPPDYAAALARAYNNWTYDYCAHNPMRLKFAGQVAMHDIRSAVTEARRCVTELGAVAIIGTPNPVNGQHLHDEACEPLWAEIERLGVPVGFHPTGETSLRDDAGRRYVGHANFHPIAHAIRNPVELMGAIASMTTGGVLERHPGLRWPFSKAPPAGSTGGCGDSTTSGKSSALAASAS